MHYFHSRCAQMEYRAATHFSGGHSDDVDYVSWNPTHPELFCTSSQRDRRIVFWDARRKDIIHFNPHTDDSLQESRHVQQIQLKVSPVQTNYAPDGKSMLYTSAGHQLFFLTYGKDSESTKDVWQISDKDGVSDICFHSKSSSLTVRPSDHCCVDCHV